MKRSKKAEDEEPFSVKWKTVRVFPNADFTNATESSQTMRDRLSSVSEYIDVELRVQKRIFDAMGCDAALSAEALAALRKAYESSPANKKKSKFTVAPPGR